MTLESLNQPNRYRGASSSKEFNKRNESARKDLDTLYCLLTQNQDNIEKSMDIILRENFFLQNRLKELKSEVDKLNRLTEEQNNSEDVSKNIYVQNFYQTEDIINNSGSNSSHLDKIHGIVSPNPTSVTSKISYTTENNTVIVPKDLEVFIKEAKNTEKNIDGELIYYDVTDEETKYMLDGEKGTFWIRDKVMKTNEGVTEVFGELHFKLPKAGVSNPYANTLIIHPYPEGSMKIQNIEYKGYGDQWSRLENFPVDKNNQPIAITNCRKLLFTFPRTEVTELRIFYSQPYWFENANEQIFSYGFQNIKLQHRLYTEKKAKFLTKIDLTEKNAQFLSVSTPEVISAPGSPKNLTNLVEHKLFYDEYTEVPFDFNADILSDIQTVYVETTLKKEGDAVPIIQEMHIPYTFKKKSYTNG